VLLILDQCTNDVGANNGSLPNATVVPDSALHRFIFVGFTFLTRTYGLTTDTDFAAANASTIFANLTRQLLHLY
ncbi:hypothetical protein EI94DRAFT_1836445, partial [Lactarius quietus]